MANKSLLTCPSCGKTYKLIPLKNGSTQSQQQDATTFQSVVETFPEQPEQIEISERRSFWASDGITYAIAGAFCGCAILLFGWWYELSAGWVAVVAALLTGGGLHALKIILHAPARPAKPAERVKKIQVEHWSDDNRHVILEEIQDDKITLDELTRVAVAVITDGHNFSRPALCSNADISQAKFWRIKKEFERLHYAHTTKANQTVLTPRAHAFLRKLATMEK